MNIYTNTLIIYLVGVLVAAFGIRNVNSKLKFKRECIPALLCLLSWFAVLVIIMLKIDFSKIDKFFKYTDKE
jgi:hypothetical protein